MLDVSLVIREEQIDKILSQERPKRIGLEAPDGLLSALVPLAKRIEERYGVETVILLDHTWGTCDLVNFDAKRLGVDLVLNIGHSIGVEKLGRYTYLIDAEYDVDFGQVLEHAAAVIKRKNLEPVGVVTISNHKSYIMEAIHRLQKLGIDARKGEAEGALFDGQVFGCNFHSARNIAKDVNSFIFLGQSRFHAMGVYLATRRPTFMADPFFNEVVDVNPEGDKFERKAILSIYKAKDANTIGIITSLKEGQFFRSQAYKVKSDLESLGRNVVMFSLREITAERLQAIRNVDAFIETACPRVAMDNENFDRPVLSYQQALGLIRLIKGEDLGDIFDYSFWV